MLTLALMLTLASTASAFNFSSVFGSNMVLQRDVKSAVYGFASPSDSITVKVGSGKSYTATASGSGHWKVLLDPSPAGGDFTVTASSAKEDTTVSLDHVTFGDGWYFCR